MKTAAAIVGAGPVGLMLACELARLNIAAVVLEQATVPSEVPKGNGLIGAIVPIMKMRGLLRGEKRLHAIPMVRTANGNLRLRLIPLRRKSALKILPIPQRRLEETLERRALATGGTNASSSWQTGPAFRSLHPTNPQPAA